ncbi:MAG: hypothetical protein IKM28_02220 [Lachnospiraceae bacterium]|nr:hypothetical protein [Lachnospiraceae bacterium]
MKKNYTDYGMIFLFCILIGCPYLIWLFAGKYLEGKNQENRLLAERPQISEWSLTEILSFPQETETYINDHLPFRKQMINIQGKLNYYLLRSSIDKRVILGKNGWFYFNDTTNGDPIGGYKGRNLLTEYELSRIADNMQVTKDNLKAEGIDFIIFIPPDKERVYTKNMPDYYGVPSEEYPIKQIIEYLQEHTDVKIVYPIEEMVRTAETLGDEVLLYLKTDTHWTRAGAYVGARELLKECGIQLPEMLSEEIWIQEQESGAGDLARMLSITDTLGKVKTYAPNGYPLNGVKCIKAEDNRELHYQSQSLDGRKIFILRDSFCSAMAPIIGSQFRESIMWHNTTFNHDMIQKYQPDIFVMEMVERIAPIEMFHFTYQGAEEAIP